MKKITQAFIFAAGRGERMRPLTDKTPKPLLKIAGKSMLDHIIEKLNELPDLKKIIVNGFYLADELENHLKKLKNKKIIFSRESFKIETGGGLIYAADKINFDEPLLTINGDIFWQDKSISSCYVSDLELLVKSFEPKKHDILLGLKPKDEVFGHDKIIDGKIQGDFSFNKKTGELRKNSNQELSHVFVGLQIINPKILDNSPIVPFSMNHFYKKAIDENGVLQKVQGIELQGNYFHIGTVQALDRVNNLLS